MEKDWIELQGYRHRYHIFGPRKQPSPSAVALHGFGLNGFRTFRYLDEPLSQAGITVYAPDLLGFGDSDKPKRGYSLHGYADLVVGFADALNLGPVLLVGHSMGGKIAVATAALFPDRFGGLVLINSGGFSTLAPWLPVFASSKLVVDLFHNAFFVDRILPHTPFNAFLNSKDSREQLRRFRTSHYALDLRHDGIMSILSRIMIPTLIVWGRDDTILPKSTPRRIQRAIPDAQIAYIPHAGHAPMKDQPAATANAIIAFLERVANSRPEDGVPPHT